MSSRQGTLDRTLLNFRTSNSEDGRVLCRSKASVETLKYSEILGRAIHSKWEEEEEEEGVGSVAVSKCVIVKLFIMTQDGSIMLLWQ